MPFDSDDIKRALGLFDTVRRGVTIFQNAQARGFLKLLTAIVHDADTLRIVATALYESESGMKFDRLAGGEKALWFGRAKTALDALLAALEPRPMPRSQGHHVPRAGR